MSEDGGSFLQRKTGADLHRWKGRAIEFIKSPDRRSIMRQKLFDLLQKKLKKEKELNSSELFERFEKDDSGLETYFFGKPDGDVAVVGISVLPRGTRFGEVLFKNRDSTGLDVTKELASIDSRYHFIVTGNIAKFTGAGEIPIVGLARNGVELKPFIVENSKDKMREYENGGIVVNSGDFTILPFTQLKENITNSEIAEQVLFIADNTNWQQIAQLAQLKDLVSHNYIGYFFDKDGEKRYLAAIAIADVEWMLGSINRVAQENGGKSWFVACIDTGGGFAGMSKPDNKEGMGIVGPSLHFIKGERPARVYLIDPGHPRERFYDFTWTKELVSK